MKCKNCGYGLKQRCGDFEKIICTYEEGECVKITELEQENAELNEAIKHISPCGEWNDDVHDCEFRHYAIEYGSQLAKAKEIILKLYNAGRDVLMCRAEEKAYDNLEEAINDKSIEQFLNSEVEK